MGRTACLRQSGRKGWDAELDETSWAAMFRLGGDFLVAVPLSDGFHGSCIM